jgi:hypothetical protein
MPSSLGLLALGCACLSIEAIGNAEAQCLPSQTRQNVSMQRQVIPPPRPTVIATSADVPTWKRVSTGTYPGELALRNALDSIGCYPGDLAEQILTRPSFRVNAQRLDLDLVSLSARDLGIKTATARLVDIYARARNLGFELPPAEVGPQLRLQYLDQPVGEVLHVAMEPLTTWTGRSVILVVANGGAGLILIGQDVTAQEIPSTALFLFVRPMEVAAKCPGCAAALPSEGPPR